MHGVDHSAPALLIISAVSPLGKVGRQKEHLMSNPQPDHDAATLSGFDEGVCHAMRRLKGAQKAILIAVSGGADSVALMLSLVRLAGRLGLRLEVASLDHGLRPESRGEAEGVKSRAEKLGLVAHTRALGLRQGPALEQRARDARYAALEDIRLTRGLELIATAHTASDQAETVLMRLARGTSLGGAAAIRARLGTRIRPLLGVTRSEVLAYVAALGEPFFDDPMNADPKFLRVRMRQELLPLFEETAGPRVAQHLARFAHYAAEDDALLDQLAKAALTRVSRGSSLDALAIDALERPIRRRVIASWLAGNQLQVDAYLLEDILEAITQGRPATLPRDLLLVSRDGWLTTQPSPSRNFT